MFPRVGLVLLVLGALTACVPADTREWMKVNEKYTGEDFRRDVKACSPSGRLDDTCMRAKGWVDVSSNKKEQVEAKPQMSQTPGRK